MNLFRSTTIKTRLILLTGLALAALLGTVGFCLLKFAHFNGLVESDLRTLDGGTAVMLDVAAANVDFKTQVQEWKNILIRGNDPQSLEKYKKHFQERAEQVQQRLHKVQGALQKAASPHAKEVAAWPTRTRKCSTSIWPPSRPSNWPTPRPARSWTSQ